MQVLKKSRSNAQRSIARCLPRRAVLADQRRSAATSFAEMRPSTLKGWRTEASCSTMCSPHVRCAARRRPLNGTGDASYPSTCKCLIRSRPIDPSKQSQNHSPSHQQPERLTLATCNGSPSLAVACAPCEKPPSGPIFPLWDSTPTEKWSESISEPHPRMEAAKQCKENMESNLPRMRGGCCPPN